MNKRIRRFFTIVSLVCLVWSGAIAQQSYPINIIFQIFPPYPVELDAYAEPLERGILTVTNNGTVAHNVRFQLQINGPQGISAESVNPTSSTRIEPGQTIVFNRANSDELGIELSESNFSTTNLSQAQRDNIIRTRVLPEGRYTICITAFDRDSGARLSAPGAGCSEIEIIYPERPIILTPQNNEELDNNPVANINIQWIHPITPDIAMRTEYTVKIIDITSMGDGTDIEAIFDPGIPVVFEEDVQSTIYSFQLQDYNIQPGHRYAVRVTAKDRQQTLIYQAEGHSPVVRFSIKPADEEEDEEDESMDAEDLTDCVIDFTDELLGEDAEPVDCTAPNYRAVAAFPVQGDTLPFLLMPLMMEMVPYCDSYHRFSFSTFVEENGNSTRHYFRRGDNNWLNGALAYLQRFDENASEYEASFYALNRIYGDERMDDFARGKTYTWQAETEVTVAGLAEPKTSNFRVEGFSIGMPKPQLVGPLNGGRVQPGNITLKWKTGNEPSVPLPPFQPYRLEGSSEADFLTIGEVKEKYVLYLAKDSLFNEMVRVHSGLLEHNDHAELTSDRYFDELAFLEAVFKDLDYQVEITERDTFYWKVGWLKDPDRQGEINLTSLPPESEYYWFGNTWQFIVSDEIEEEDPLGECIAECESPEPTDREALTSYEAGETVNVGRFSMRITNIRYNGSLANGAGTIQVPVLRAPIKVEFSNIKINAQRQVFFDAGVQGEIKAISERPDVFSTSLLRGTGTALGLSDQVSGELANYIHDAANTVSMFVGDTPRGLPIGLDTTIEGNRYSIGVVGMNFTPTYAFLDAVFILDFPDFDGWLALGATDICFHPQGLASLNRALLYNPVDKEIEISSDVKIVFPKTVFGQTDTTGTYVKWDCRGFNTLSVGGYIEFSREIMLPDQENGLPAPSGNVKAHFRFTVREKENWFARLDFENFQVKGLDGWGFSVDEAWWDFSDRDNPTNMKFPRLYQGDREKTWKGFYLKQATVKLPPEFRTFTDANRRLTIGIDSTIIDGTGITTSIFARNLLEIADGNVDGWRFSIDTVVVNIVNNSLTNGGLKGKINLPLGDESKLKYDALLHHNAGNFGFQFRIQPDGEFNADIWEATVSLQPTSIIGINLGNLQQVDRNGDGRVTEFDWHEGAYAFLNGNLSIRGTGDLPMDIPALRFEGLSMNTWGITGEDGNKKYFDCQRISFNSPQRSVAGFPIAIDSFFFINRMEKATLVDVAPDGGQRVGLGFRIGVTIMEGNNAFRANTVIGILARVNVDLNEPKRFEVDFAGVDFNEINISGEIGVVEISGGLKLFNGDATFGNGFKGYLSAKFKPTIALSAVVQFGNVNGLEYWYVDASAEFNPGIDLCPGLSFRGFGGGAWYNMALTAPPTQANILPARTPSTQELSQAGTTSSGLRYTPSSGAWGFRAQVRMGPSGGGDAYKLKIALGADFSSNGGIARMYLDGELIVMANDAERNPPVKGTLSAEYNFEENIFHANVEVFIDFEVVYGAGENKKAGSIDIYASPDKWHIWINHPENRNGLKVALLESLNASLQFYMMVGNDLPPMPPPPANILSAPGFAELDMSRFLSSAELDTISSGEGFMFGADFQLSFNPTFLMFYARLSTHIGFDLALKNYSGLSCGGRESIGLNGWYASGQLYGRIDGAVGIKVDLGFINGEFEIFSLGLAAILQGGFPNPEWATGAVGGYFSILNGAVSGTCNFQFSIGERCRPGQGPLSGIPLIVDVKPQNGATDVDCGVMPAATFGMKVDFPFELKDVDSGRVRTFRIRYRDFRLTRKSNGAEEQVLEYITSDDKLTVSLNPSNWLRAHTEYRLEVTAFAEEQINGQWRGGIDGRTHEEKRDISFTTGAAPDSIHSRDVWYSSPYHDQRYFLQASCNRIGMIVTSRNNHPALSGIKRNRGQESSTLGDGVEAQFISINGTDTIPADVWWPRNCRAIHFEIPNLRAESVYMLQITRDPSAEESRTALFAAIAGGLNNRPLRQVLQTRSAISTRLNTLNSLVNVNQTQVDATNIKGGDKKRVYSFYFKTSRFGSPQEKIAAIASRSSSHSTSWDVYMVNYDNPVEPFDEFDLSPYRFRHAGATNYIPALFYLSNTGTSAWHRNFDELYGLGLYRISTGLITQYPVAGSNVQSYFLQTRRYAPAFGTPDGSRFASSPLVNGYDYYNTSGINYALYQGLILGGSALNLSPRIAQSIQFYDALYWHYRPDYSNFRHFFSANISQRGWNWIPTLMRSRVAWLLDHSTPRKYSNYSGDFEYHVWYAPPCISRPQESCQFYEGLLPAGRLRFNIPPTLSFMPPAIATFSNYSFGTIIN